jgi:hypothetical protein
MKQPILEGFNKEQDAFIKSQQGAGGSGVCPWVGHVNEEQIKEEIMGLSAVNITLSATEYLSGLCTGFLWQSILIFTSFQDRRNFVRAPPVGVDFEFDYGLAYPTALAIMAEDKQLEQMRFELVPKM